MRPGCGDAPAAACRSGPAPGGVATSDLVQDVLQHTFARLTWFESTHVSALRAYLRRAVENRVQDERRRATRRLDLARLAPGKVPLRPFEDAAPQYQQRLQDELWGRYRDGLKRLTVRDRRLIVGRAELGYTGLTGTFYTSGNER